MAVKPIDAASCEFTWSGTFEPKGMSDAQAVAFFDDVYRSVLGMIERALAGRGCGEVLQLARQRNIIWTFSP